MNAFHKILIPLFALLFTVVVPMSAQQEENNEGTTKVIIITKTIDEDGNEVVKKIVKEGVSDEEFSEGGEFHFDTDDEDEVQVKIFRGNKADYKDIHIDVDEDGGQKRIRLSGVDENGEEFDIEWEGDGEIPAHIQEKMNSRKGHDGRHHGKRIKKYHFGNHDDSPFLGVMMGKNVERINGVETITGVSDKGVVVNDVVEGSAAEEAGLQSEDIITKINGQSVKNLGELTEQIQDLKIGDKIKINYLRDGKSKKTEATLKARKMTPRGGGNSFQWRNDNNRNHSISRGDHFNFKQPCKPFIGVYLNLGSDNEDGIAVQRIIPNTPASEVKLQVGDIITAIDEINVGSHSALILERDKHAAGDQFTLTYLRDGASNTVTATFPSCDEKSMTKNRKMIIIKKYEEGEEENINTSPTEANPFAVPESNLTLTGFNSFPNPTDGLVTVQFNAEAGPLMVRVVDIAGKEIYREEIINFDGYYNQQIDLSKAAAGTLLLSIRQGDQSFTDKIILRKDN